MINDPKAFARTTLASIGEDQFRDDAPSDNPAHLSETEWAIDRLSDEGLERLSTFLLDLTRRAPLSGPVFSAQRIVIESLDSDVRREIDRRIVKGDSRNGTD
jgi:hypothetical protein